MAAAGGDEIRDGSRPIAVVAEVTASPRGGSKAVGGLRHSDGRIRSRLSRPLQGCPAPDLCLRLHLDWQRCKDDVVRVRATRHSAHPVELVERQRVARSPSDHVIGAGRVAADPEAAYSLAPYIERKAAAEYIDAADALADHRILRRAEGCEASGRSVPLAFLRLVAVGDVGLDRIASLPPGCTAE